MQYDPPRMSTPLQRAAREAVKEHGGIGRAALATGLNPATLWRFATGKQKQAGPKACKALGLEKRVTYRQVSRLPLATAKPQA